MDQSNIYELYEQNNLKATTDLANRLYGSIDESFDIQCDLILDEIMRRVKRNFDISFGVLQKYGYEFYDLDCFERKEGANKEVDSMLKELEVLLKPFGEIPKSVISFLKFISTGISFLGKFDGIDSGLVPFQIYSLGDTLKYMKFALPNHSDLYLKPEDGNDWFIPLIQNDLDKENISSSGELIGVKLYKKKKFDGFIINHKYDCSFVDYLREYFKWGGFLGLRENELLLRENEKIKSYLEEFKSLMIEF